VTTPPRRGLEVPFFTSSVHLKAELEITTHPVGPGDNRPPDAPRYHSAKDFRRPIRLSVLPLLWSWLTPEEQKQLWNEWHISRAVLHSLHWARRWTKTKDEQDPENPYKHLPSYEYFDALHAAAEKFNVLFVEDASGLDGLVRENPASAYRVEAGEFRFVGVKRPTFRCPLF
jgi:hypothetical protein